MRIRKTEVWSVSDFVSKKPATYVEGKDIDVSTIVAVSLAVGIGLSYTDVFAATPIVDGPVSKAFDKKIWPLMLDIGKPLAKSMMAIGIYKCIRNDVNRGWQTVYRSGIGLVALFLIDGAIRIISGVGQDLQNGS